METKYYDIFISHASEDRQSVAEPIAKKLQDRGFSVWLDTQQLELGTKVGIKINEGLRLSRFGVAILSQEYFAKRWPIDELEALLARDVVLPVRHCLSQDAVRGHHPIVANLKSASTDEGIEKVVEQIVQRIETRNSDGVKVGPANRENGSNTAASVVRHEMVDLGQAKPLVEFIMIRVLSENQDERNQPWNELRPGEFQRNWDLDADPVFDIMVVNNSLEPMVFQTVGVRILQRKPGNGGIYGVPEHIPILCNLRVSCREEWKRSDLTNDRSWAPLPDPIRIQRDDSPFRFTLLLENFCDIDNASSSELRFYLGTKSSVFESESIWLSQ